MLPTLSIWLAATLSFLISKVRERLGEEHPPHQKNPATHTVVIGFFGGNSTKATSGINGALTRTQIDHKIQDSVKQFYDDTLKSARDKARPDLIKVLTYKSAAAVEWLQDVFNLDLTLVSRLG